MHYSIVGANSFLDFFNFSCWNFAYSIGILQEFLSEKQPASPKLNGIEEFRINIWAETKSIYFFDCSCGTQLILK